jgi:hypothetical protein
VSDDDRDNENEVEGRPDADDENVVDLFPKVGVPAVLAEGWRHRACKHNRISLDVETRTASCRRCEAEVDVFDWLVEHLGNPWRALWSQYQGMRADLERLARERVQLRREVKNLKAQAKRWRNKQPPSEPVADGKLQLVPERKPRR